MTADNPDFDDDDERKCKVTTTFADEDLNTVSQYYDDDDFEDDDFDDDLPSRRRRKKYKRFFCRHCNRMETHKPDRRKSTLKSFVTGLMLGLNLLIGKVQCVCCGHYRWKYKLTGNKKK